LKTIDLSEIKFDCRHFRGGIPCKPNKLRGRICHQCPEYDRIETRILIIKLGALGDVIRTTPLIERFKKTYPGVHITWITHSPDILPAQQIDEIYRFDFLNTYIVRHQHYHIALNLDKEPEACALLADVQADKKFGFEWKDHHIDVADDRAVHKLVTGLFDAYSIQNRKNYLDEIFEICGFDFQGEEYVLDVDEGLKDLWAGKFQQISGQKKIVGLNTGCGQRWPTRLWPTENWISLIGLLKEAGYFPVVLGGVDEDAQNKEYEKLTGAYYPGTYSLKEFIALTSGCDLVVTAVSMMMHIAIGLKKPLVLFNNIFNSNEFYMYGRGEIVGPELGCDCFYGNTCTRDKHCMDSLGVNTVFDSINRLIK
jgi:heptosyltransferase-2